MLDFIGIGSQKCGTTWLYEKLRLHPQLGFPLGKEAHFWDIHYSKGVGWYRDGFKNVGVMEGEITPAYAILPLEKIREIYTTFPNLKLFMIIRNPQERAWSSAKMALARSEMLLEEASDQWFVDHFHSIGSRRRGNYEQCIRNWRTIFPSDRLAIYRFETLRQDPQLLLEKCCGHIGVDAAPILESCMSNLSTPVFQTMKAPIPERLQLILNSIYHDEIESLSGYLGLDLSEWHGVGV